MDSPVYRIPTGESRLRGVDFEFENLREKFKTTLGYL